MFKRNMEQFVPPKKTCLPFQVAAITGSQEFFDCLKLVLNLGEKLCRAIL